MAKEKRFIKIYSQSAGTVQIWLDTETGVNYMYCGIGYGGGLTPLLDSEGKVVVTRPDKIDSQEEQFH